MGRRADRTPPLAPRPALVPDAQRDAQVSGAPLPRCEDEGPPRPFALHVDEHLGEEAHGAVGGRGVERALARGRGTASDSLSLGALFECGRVTPPLQICSRTVS